MKSQTQSWFGRVALKSRFTWSGAREWELSGWVVKRFFARLVPRIPSRLMSRATWSRPTSRRARRAAFQSLRRP